MGQSRADEDGEHTMLGICTGGPPQVPMHPGGPHAAGINSSCDFTGWRESGGRVRREVDLPFAEGGCREL